MFLLCSGSGLLLLFHSLFTVLAADTVAQGHFISVESGPEDLIRYDMGKVFHPGNGLFI
ncbi:hypothetical protein TCA2_3590 [Paenibacillus sp. TCA20]|nr:hypothetical protein TCA2_3590 [Paenibacillus sp. TCA20]